MTKTGKKLEQAWIKRLSIATNLGKATEKAYAIAADMTKEEIRQAWADGLKELTGKHEEAKPDALEITSSKSFRWVARTNDALYRLIQHAKDYTGTSTRLAKNRHRLGGAPEKPDHDIHYDPEKMGPFKIFERNEVDIKGFGDALVSMFSRIPEDIIRQELPKALKKVGKAGALKAERMEAVA